MFTGSSPILASLAVRTDIKVFITGPGFDSISPHKSNEYLSDVSSFCIIHLVVGNSFDSFDLNMRFLVLFWVLPCLRHLQFMLFLSQLDGLQYCGHVLICRWKTYFLNVILSKLCQKDDMGIGCFINNFSLRLRFLFFLIKLTIFLTGILDASRWRSLTFSSCKRFRIRDLHRTKL